MCVLNDAHPRPQWPLRLDMVSGRSKQVFKPGWPPSPWRERIEIVMDGFTGFKSAAMKLPARRSWTPSTSYLAGNALDECRRRSQQSHHRRGRAWSHQGRRMLTRSCLLTARQRHQILDLFFQRRARRRITWVSTRTSSTPTAHPTRVGRCTKSRSPQLHRHALLPHQAHHLGRTPQSMSRGILAYFDTTQAATEAINAPLEHAAPPQGLQETSPTTSPSTPRNRRIQAPTTPIYEEPVMADA